MKKAWLWQIAVLLGNCSGLDKNTQLHRPFFITIQLLATIVLTET
jgi:hypothetical protein